MRTIYQISSGANNMYNKRITINDLFMYIIAALLILNHSVYYYMDGSRRVTQIFIPLCTLLFFYFQCLKLSKKILKNWLMVFAIYLVINLLYSYFSIQPGDWLSYGTRYIIFIPLMALVFAHNEWSNKKYQLFYCLSHIICFIAAISLFFWLSASVFQLIKPTGIAITNWGSEIRPGVKGGYNYYYVYYEMQPALGAISKFVAYRNCGIFSEGPAFAVFLCISLFIELFLKDRIKGIRIFVLLSALMTTFTTTGILFLLVMISLKWFLFSKGSMKIRFIILPMVMILLILGAMFLISTKANQGSVRNRFSDYIYGFRAFLQSPLYGYGYSFDANAAFRAGYSNSISDVLVRGGILHSMIYFVPLFYMSFMKLKRNRHKFSKEDRRTTAIGVCILYFFIINILSQTFILLAFLAYGYKEIMNGINRIEGKKDG